MVTVAAIIITFILGILIGAALQHALTERIERAAYIRRWEEIANAKETGLAPGQDA